jgi:hypothetical protein
MKLTVFGYNVICSLGYLIKIILFVEQKLLGNIILCISACDDITCQLRRRQNTTLIQ